MSDDPRLDARLRAALLDGPAPDELRTRAALDDVLARSSASQRRRRVAIPLAVAAAVLAVLAVLPVLVPRGDDRERPQPVEPVPTAVEGSWRRTAQGLGPAGWDGAWQVTLDADGVLRVRGPVSADVRVDGASYRVDGDLLLLDPFVNDVCADADAGLYRWRRAGDRLVLSAVEEPCPAREALFDGTWSRP